MSPSARSEANADSVFQTLCWRVHLLRRNPDRLPVLLMVLGIGVACVWLMFGTLLPMLAALLLLAGSVSEYLFPIAYRISPHEIGLDSITSRMTLSWTEVRRCRLYPHAVLLTSLSSPSRLDAFRGILLRFAPDGQPGDRQSVLAALTTSAPQLPGLSVNCLQGNSRQENCLQEDSLQED